MQLGRQIAAPGRTQQPRSLIAAAQTSSRAARPIRSRVATEAAKKGGAKDKKGAQKKGGGALEGLLKKKAEAAGAGMAADEPATPAQYADPELNLLLLGVCTSYWKAYGEYLITVDLKNLAEALYKAPFVCLAHNKFEEGVEDPTYVYANRAALRLFEGTWDEIVGMPSRLSADELGQADRNLLVQQAADTGSIDNYEGWRQSVKGRRFKVRGVRLFNVSEVTGELFGQAAVFREYEEEDGTVVSVQGDAPPAPELPPTDDELQAATDAVAAQAAAVRELKEAKGLGNQDPEVIAAVAELKARKDAQAALQAKWDELTGGAIQDTLEDAEE